MNGTQDDRIHVRRANRERIRVEAIITNTARLARDIGVYYFGWEASNGALRYYTGLKPLMLTGYINGCAMGFLRGHGLRFDERIIAKNDFYRRDERAPAPALREGLPLQVLPK